MTIHRSIVEDIMYELTHREEVKEHYNYDTQMYYAHMVGRMSVVIEMILDKDSKIAD